MSWPGITDYSEAVQNPRLCFKGTELEPGQYRSTSGACPSSSPGPSRASIPCPWQTVLSPCRCFTREVSDQQTRYGELSGYLLNVLPPSFVHFEYVERGISLRGDWYPIVRMEWVDGELLSRFVGSRLDQPDTLRRVAAQWRGGPTASLRGLRIAHNDLQHGNVLVQRDGSIRLVDYDGMFLPRFRGERSPELGHKNYQHPERSAEHYDENVDNFPSLVIYLSLLAIASDPGLWDFHDEDNLIFTRNDYADPRSSEVFGRLKRSPRPGGGQAGGASRGVLRSASGEGPRPGDGPAGHSTQRGGADAGSPVTSRSTGVNTINGLDPHRQLIPSDAWSRPTNAGASHTTAGQTAAHHATGRKTGTGGPTASARLPSQPACACRFHEGRSGPNPGGGGHLRLRTEAQRLVQGVQESGGGSRGHSSRSHRGCGGAHRLGIRTAGVVPGAVAAARKGSACSLRPSPGKDMGDDSDNEDGNPCRGDYGGQVLEP